MKNELKLISMDTVETENVQWLWYPYIPLGKITIVHGDPGEGKTTFALAVIASLTKGEPLPECEDAIETMNVIYQTAEDGLADTIKPRLVAAGADCTRVLVIDETDKELTLNDERLEEAIKETGAQLIVLDPIQAYLGEDVDMHRANEVRPVLKRLAAMAERTHCAVLLVGHLNKAQGQKSSYRGLGSIDFRAAARSVLVVGRLKDNERIRVVAQDKNSLAPEGSSIAFELNEQTGFCWKGACEATVDDVLNGTGKVQTKTMLMEEELKRMLSGRVPAEEVQKKAKAMGVSKRTLDTQFYIDDGYSGANFNRPAFEQMMTDAANGDIAVVITKDLSRLGRNQLYTGLYIEEIFPSYNVRYIAINDNVDTLYETSNELMPFKNLFNEWHVRDCSRKVRAVFNAKAQRGERIGTRAPYGYRKSEIKGDPLEVDEEAAQVVKRIFAMCASGLGPSQIARQLRDEKVLSPSMYAYTKYGISHSGLNTERPYNWTSDMVSDMLMNMVYLGHTVNMRYSTKSYKDKKKRERPKSDWLIFENTHEALVDQETWDIVQEVRSHKRRRTNMDEQNMFSGLVYCADCGKPMVLHRAHTMKPEQNNFTCRTYKKDGAAVCTAHYIREIALKDTVLETIRRAAEFARNYPEKFAEYIQQRQSREVAKEIRQLELNLTNMKKRSAELDTIFKRMYEDCALGRVSNEQFRLLSEAYSKEKDQLAESIPAATARLEKLRGSVANVKSFIAKARKYTDMSELTPEILRVFVSKIIVHEKEVKHSKHAPQKVRIRFRDFDLDEANDPFFAENEEKADSANALSA